ncbi:endonuclease/exonuclease/phosphatase family protein [Microbacterium sp. WCS2018Hpa-9]|uniref:endonuclease/exonuclease/phosphatase family protein n=1 Tax=Microbacterium sp. WCS2018Hpa-9 TaxID=3073635 RepID=UPI00288B71B9|nr:endonuclease/exonuclease/phosphatase family protein [Microbacterium sp. WCS2018Hpa-9]
MTAPPLIGPALAPELHVMSFNIRRAMEGRLRPERDRWSVRAPAVAEMLGSERPTILGLQEVRPRAMTVVTRAIGRTHRFVGRGRARDGAGEGSPLVYDAERLELRGWEQRALSARPDEPGSRSWGNLLPRILVTAEFSDRSTGVRFIVVNAHLDHLSSRSRRRSAEAITALIRERALPAIVMGDLNAGPRSEAVRTLLSRAELTDSWSAAEDRLTPLWSTLNGYHPPRLTGRRVDWMLVSRDVRVRAAAINARVFDGIRPSDHLAVQVMLRMDGKTQ